MVAFKVIETKEIVILLFITIFIASSYAINLDINAKEARSADNPISNKKYTPNTSVLLNVRPNLAKAPKMFSKLMNIKLAETKLDFKNSRSRKRRSIGIPKLPLVPFLLPLIPRILPILPSALNPSLKQRLPSLKKAGNLNLVKKKELTPKEKFRVYEKLQEMRNKGFLTYAEYHRFRKILL